MRLRLRAWHNDVHAATSVFDAGAVRAGGNLRGDRAITLVGDAGRDFGEELIRKASDPDIAEAIADDFRMAGTVDSGPVQLVYKARPLNGIWATAPYLHNGSVRTLRQLLLASDTRQTTFRVGSREYDPKDVGFVDDGAYLFDTRLPGNSNRGHEGPEYGTAELQADPEMLEALLEYLKTL